MSAADLKKHTEGKQTIRPWYDRDVKRTANDTDIEDSESDLDQDANFIDESVRHLTVGKIKVSKVSDMEKKLFQ